MERRQGVSGLWGEGKVLCCLEAATVFGATHWKNCNHLLQHADLLGEKGKGHIRAMRWFCAQGSPMGDIQPGPLRCPCRPLYLKMRAVVTVGVHDLPLSPIPGQHRHHFSSCQVSMELGGEDADASSGQSLGEGRLKPLCLTPSLSPPVHPLALCWRPAVPGPVPTEGFRGLLYPWSSVEVRSLQRDRCSIRCQIRCTRCCALSQQEQLSRTLLASLRSLVVAQMIPFG